MAQWVATLSPIVERRTAEPWKYGWIEGVEFARVLVSSAAWPLVVLVYDVSRFSDRHDIVVAGSDRLELAEPFLNPSPANGRLLPRR